MNRTASKVARREWAPARGIFSSVRPNWRTPVARPNKYGAKTCRYNGAIYHSRKEADYAAQLDQLAEAREPRFRVINWIRQVKVPLRVEGKLIANYFVDFEVHYADGRNEWHEVKGYETPEWKLKRKLFEALYPNRILRVQRIGS